jgi:ABC-type phosphate transport system permease subunit
LTSTATTVGRGHPITGRPRSARLPDQLLKWGLTVLAVGVLALIVFFFVSLYDEAHLAFSKFGYIGFTFDNDWDVSKSIYGALPLVVGTLITAGVALVIGVTVAVAAALYVTELCPRRLRTPLTILIDLLAAVPSIVYGLWGVFVLIPNLRPAEQWFSDTFSFLPFVGGPVAGPNYFIGGLILAIMILPIVSAISREVIATVPRDHKEAALALGAAMLGLGRAVGETIAVTLVVGNAPQIGKHLFDQGYTLAAVIANEFGEAAATPLHRSALIAAGLVLFVLTLIVNGVARWYVNRAERTGRLPQGAAMAGAPGE